MKFLGKTGIDFGFARVVFGPFGLEAGERRASLSFSEFVILRGLAKSADGPVSRDALLRLLDHEPGEESGSRAVDVHVSSLRKKLRLLLREEGPPPDWNPIRAVRGRGYVLAKRGVQAKRLNKTPRLK
jgi:DNA-binding response OmpR family regulator